MIYALIIFNVLAVWWFVEANRQCVRTNADILDLNTRSRDLTLDERRTLEDKITNDKWSYDASRIFFALAVVSNCFFGFYKLVSWIVS